MPPWPSCKGCPSAGWCRDAPEADPCVVAGGALVTATPYMQLYVGDYLSDTLHLTTEQHGAYLLLLMTMWRSGASLPNDAAKLARICRVSPKRWPGVWSEISGFFDVDRDVIRNDRLTKEHSKAVSISQERKTAAKKGGQAKALKDKQSNMPNGSDLPCHSQKSESEPDIKKEETYVSPPVTDDAAAAVEVYNDAAKRSGWARVQRMNRPRFSALKARLTEAGGLEGWRIAIQRAEASDFLCGRRHGRDGPFFASFDFLTQPSSFTRLMEGNYDNRTDQRPARQSAEGRQDRADPALANIARIVGLGAASGDGRG